MSDEQELRIQPIGYIRCEKRVKFSALHQPDESGDESNVLEILPQENLRMALQDLTRFSRIWLLWWFHKNDTWRPLVLPPRGPAQRRGVLATRSPHRPNPLGMTPVKLLGVEGFRLLLGPCDLVDGTPVFDIKPYIPEYDSFPDENSGWLEDVRAWQEQPPTHRVIWSVKATQQRDWLAQEHGVDFSDRVEDMLSRDPSVHRTRRIRRREGDLREIGCGAWRAVFSLEGNVVHIVHIEPGYPLASLTDRFAEKIPDRDAQAAYFVCWPEYA